MVVSTQRITAARLQRIQTCLNRGGKGRAGASDALDDVLTTLRSGDPESIAAVIQAGAESVQSPPPTLQWEVTSDQLAEVTAGLTTIGDFLRGQRSDLAAARCGFSDFLSFCSAHRLNPGAATALGEAMARSMPA